MARMVRVTIEYDMDDTEKSLGAELQTWYDHKVTVEDVVYSEDWKQGGTTQQGYGKVWIEAIQDEGEEPGEHMIQDVPPPEPISLGEQETCGP